MKKKIISSSIVAGFLALLMFVVPILEKNTRAEDVGYDSNTHHITYVKDSNYEVGTAQNHYTIMELVPTDDMATLGYLLTGKGKVPESALASEITGDENSASAIYKRLFASNTATTDASKYDTNSTLLTDTVATAGTQQTKAFTSDLTTGGTSTNNFVNVSYPEFAQYGYFVRVKDGEGRYKLTKTDNQTITDKDGNTKTGPVYKFELNNDAGIGGNFNWVSLGYFEKAAGTDGYYQFSANTDIDTGETVGNAKKFDMFFDTEIELETGTGYYYYLDEDGKKVYCDENGNDVSDDNKVKAPGYDTEETKTDKNGTDETKNGENGTDVNTGTGTENGGTTNTDSNTTEGSSTQNGASDSTGASDSSGNSGNSGTSSEDPGSSGGGSTETNTQSPMSFNYNSKSVTMSLAAAKNDAKFAIASKNAAKVALANNTNAGTQSSVQNNASGTTSTGDNSSSNTSGTSTSTDNSSNASQGSDSSTTTSGADSGTKSNTTVSDDKNNTDAQDLDENNKDTTVDEETNEEEKSTSTDTGKTVKKKSNKLPRKGSGSPNSVLATDDNIAYGYGAFTAKGDNQVDTTYNFYPNDSSIPTLPDPTEIKHLTTFINSQNGSGDRYYTYRFDKNYGEAVSNVITNNDTLAKEILGKGVYSDTNPDGAYIDVIALTPTEINDAVKNGNGTYFINDVDMIVIHDMLDARLVEKSNDWYRDLDKDGKEGAHLTALKNASSSSGSSGSGTAPAKGNGLGWDEEEDTETTEDVQTKDSTPTTTDSKTGTTTDSTTGTTTDSSTGATTDSSTTDTTNATDSKQTNGTDATTTTTSDTTKVTTTPTQSNAADTKVDTATSGNASATGTGATGTTSEGTTETTSENNSTKSENGNNTAGSGTATGAGTGTTTGTTDGTATTNNGLNLSPTPLDAGNNGNANVGDANADGNGNGQGNNNQDNANASVNTTVSSNFHGDDAAGLLESAVNSGLVDVTNLKGVSAYKKNSDGSVSSDRLDKTSAKATRGYFTYGNDIDKNVLDLIVKRQAGNNPACMVLDSSAIYKDSTTRLDTLSDDKTTTTVKEVSNYHDGVPAAVGLELIPTGGIQDVSCSHPERHKDLHTVANSNQVKTRTYTFKFTNNALSGLNNGGISPEKITIYLPRYVFYDEYANQGSRSTIRSVTQTINGNYNVLTLDIRNKYNNDSFFGNYTKIDETKTAGELYLCSSFDDVDKLQNFDITKYPVYMTVTDGKKEIDVTANQDVAPYLNELYVIMNYYGAKYYWNVFCAKYDDNGNYTGYTVPDYADYSIMGVPSNEDTDHTYPIVNATYDTNYPYSKTGGQDEIKDALVPLTESPISYNYYSNANANGSYDSGNYHTMLDQPSYGNGIGKSPFVWDFDGNRSAFSTAFNMSGLIASTETDNNDGTYTPGTVQVSTDTAYDTGIAAPSDISTDDKQNLSEVFDDRFLTDTNGNVIRDANGTAQTVTSIKRPTLMSFIDKESNGYNGTTGDKYKTTLKILEIEPTDEFIYGSYFKTESNDGRSKSNGTKYYDKMGGILLDTNIDYYSNFDAIKNGYVNGTQANWNDTRNSYIHYETKDWKDWKEYYYSMFPGFIGENEDGDLNQDVTIETIPIWQFNADNTDINSEYDIVVVGATQNYKNGQLKRIYTYVNNRNANFWIDTKMDGANPGNKIEYRRFASYNDTSLNSFDHSQFRSWQNNQTPPTHDTFGDPSYALAWTSVGDLVDTSTGSFAWGVSGSNDYWYSGYSKDSNQAKTTYTSINFSSSLWMSSRFTNKNITIDSAGGTDASQAKTRYEARDFSKKKAELLLDFADRNLLVMDDAIYTNSNGTEQVDGSLIDSRSEMYYVAQTGKTIRGNGSVKNLYSKSNIIDNRGLFNVRKNTLLEQCEIKPTINADGSYKNWPVEYSYSGNKPNSGTSANAQKVNDTNGLIFDFTIGGKKYNDDGTLKAYYANVYADINNNAVYDGSLIEQRKTIAFAYDDTDKDGSCDNGEALTQNLDIDSGTEKVTATYVYDITDGEENKTEVSSLQPYPYNAMYAGRHYSVESALSSSFTGALGYTLELSTGSSAYDNNASNRKTEVGFTRFVQTGKKIIHILQMNPDPDMTKNYSSINTNNMQFYDKSSDAGKTFASEMAYVPDFAVSIDFLQNNASGVNGFFQYDDDADNSHKGQKWTYRADFQGGYVTLKARKQKIGKNTIADNDWPRVSNHASDSDDENTDNYTFDLSDYDQFLMFLENYDMIFLAGRDCSAVSNDPKFIKALNAYSENGGSIIMSHDMIGSVYSTNATFAGNRGRYNNTSKLSNYQVQDILETYYFRKLGGQVEKYYTPGTTNYSYNSMAGSSNTSYDRQSVTMMPLEKTFLVKTKSWNDKQNGRIANDMRFPDEYDIRKSADYLNLIVGDKYYSADNPPADSESNSGILCAANNDGDLWFNNATYPITNKSLYDDGSVDGHVGTNVQYLSSVVSNNDVYNYQHYSRREVSGIGGSAALNSLGLEKSGSTDLVYGDRHHWNTTTRRIKNVNKGKVSSYPFDLLKVENRNGFVDVANTHVQQYRLDLDHTNDPKPEVSGKMTNITDDTIVWYDLSGSTIYDYLKGDAANNYYIYTKGNITYTGVGHSDVGKGINEIDLFINTMIASYRPSPAEPYIRIMNTDAHTAGKKTSIYFDESTGSDGNVVFRVMDPSLANVQREYYVKVYKLDADGNEREVGAPDITFTGAGMSQDNTWSNIVMTNDETNFNTKVTLNTDYSFPGNVGETYRIHLMYVTHRNNKITQLDTWQDVTLQNLEYFDLY